MKRWKHSARIVIILSILVIFLVVALEQERVISRLQAWSILAASPFPPIP